MKQTVPSFAGYLSGFEVLQKARGPFEHTPAATPSVAPPAKDSRHIDVLGSKVNPSAEQRAAKQASAAKHGRSANRGYFTASERHALRNYTKSPWDATNAGHHQAVNDVLEGGKRDYVKETRHADRAGKLINQAISHAKIPKNMNLYRSGHMPQGLKEGDVVSSPRLMSTSKSKFVANKFNKDPHPDGASIHIKARKGDNAFDYTHHGLSDHFLESEVLFGSGHKFHVHGVKTNSKTGHRTVTLATYPKRQRKTVENKPLEKAAPASGGRLHDLDHPAVVRHGARISDHPRFNVLGRQVGAVETARKAQSSFSSYQDAFQKLHDLQAQANNSGGEDQRYAWSQYQRLFEVNHRAMDALQQAQMLRRLERGQ